MPDVPRTFIHTVSVGPHAPNACRPARLLAAHAPPDFDLPRSTEVLPRTLEYSWNCAMAEATALDSELREMNFRWAMHASGFDLCLCPPWFLVHVGGILRAGGSN